MKLNEKIIKIDYQSGLNSDDKAVKFYYFWNVFLKLCEENKYEGDGLRASIRRFIENNYDNVDKDIDYEDFRLDVLYERPVFEDLRVEENRDVYYYQDFNTNRPGRANDDYFLSIKSFQRILEQSDLISIYMSIFKIYNHLLNIDDNNYSERDLRLIDASVYILECALNNLM